MVKRSFARLDVKGFIHSLRIDAYGALFEVMLKYILAPLLRTFYSREDILKWVDLFNSVLGTERFLFIVLDDARYDVFKSIYSRYLNGDLKPCLVPPPNTYGWLPKVFSLPEFNNVRVFYASLGIKTHDIRIGDFIPKNRSVEVYAIKPKRFEHLGTVLPNEVNEVIKRVGLSGRDIVWYVQPHFPWVCDEELSLLLMHEVLVHDFLPPDTIKRALKKYGISRDRVLKAYYCNMEIALRGARDLLDYVREQGLMYDKIVITSDHGEMLGEYGLYLHQEYNLPQLTIVPWLEVRL